MKVGGGAAEGTQEAPDLARVTAGAGSGDGGNSSRSPISLVIRQLVPSLWGAHVGGGGGTRGLLQATPESPLDSLARIYLTFESLMVLLPTGPGESQEGGRTLRQEVAKILIALHVVSFWHSHQNCLELFCFN